VRKLSRFDLVRPSDLKLFAHSDDWWHNATLNTGAAEWHTLAEGYKDAADIVVENTSSVGANLNWVAFPVVFLYRQYLELSIKALLLSAGGLLDRSESPGTSHSLLTSWQRLRPMLEEISPSEEPRFFNDFELRIREFEALDPGSYAFRYPVDKHGSPTLPQDQPVNTRHLMEVVEGLSVLVDGAGAMISEYEGFKQEY
jgi:hypothetical protein